MKIGDKKVQRALKKQTARGLLQDKKVPGASTGTWVTGAPGPRLLGLPQDSWERAGLRAPSPDEQGLNSRKIDLGAEVAGRGREGNKDEVVNPRRLWAPVGNGLEKLRVGPCGALTRTVRV